MGTRAPLSQGGLMIWFWLLCVAVCLWAAGKLYDDGSGQ